MDHFPIIHNPIYPPIRVPVLGSRNKRYVYDHKGFYGYPERAGFDLSVLKTREIPEGKYSDDVASFLQAWLFFGLFEELLSSASEFVREVLFEKGQFGKPTPPDVTLSIAILGETLSHARNLAYYIAPGSKQEGIWTPDCNPPWESEQLIQSLKLLDHLGRAFLMPWGSVYSLTQRLEERGFCRSEIKFLGGYTISSAYFASCISRYKKGNHVNCTETKCITYQVTSEYRSMQVNDKDCIDSHCGLEVDTDKLSSLLRKGATPVSVRSIEGDSEKVKIEIKDSALVDQYVAISHVWSDRLGNPEANALYCCQLQRTQEMVDGLGHITESSDPVRFWIDTLCIPVQNEQDRRLAISDMAKYYSEASCVLVLDADLMACSTMVSPNELLLRISLSTWMRRLWTLQEGALTKRLYFQFKDGTASLNDLVKEVNSQQSVANIHAYDPCFIF
ncbi:HET domain protein [Talaromyces marneffei ATCC 18224]|uniref:HET domain protein n=1 Tax=Talaromyces marneffei (strain ATCC 18224 / CBS 334.59 / QM 7333) TaxID=441960 RepID=B6QSP2_TALMQ|nr:HET domain protein [Talaromyces marneffei ATCC 18224]